MASGRAGNPLSFGGRVPAAVGGLIVATVVTSLVAAVGGRSGLGLHQLLLLDTGAVWQGRGLAARHLGARRERPREPALRRAGALLVRPGPRRGVGRAALPRHLLRRPGGGRRPGLAARARLARGSTPTASPASGWRSTPSSWPGGSTTRSGRSCSSSPSRSPERRSSGSPWAARSSSRSSPASAAFVPHLLAEGIAWLHVSGKGPGQWLRRIRLPRRKRRGRFEVIHADRDPDRRWLN